MKKLQIITLAVLFFGFNFLTAQVNQVNLEQKKGMFTQESVMLAAGDYQFNISNNDVGHDVGFVLVPKGMYDADKHIKEAYVTSPVPTGMTKSSNVVSLSPGEYEYFCPMNPTPKYTLVVKAGVETITLGQVPGTFKVQGLTVTEGDYQFNIANNGVDHEVGFVLVPKGMYDASKHIKEAYVKAPVANGSSSMTGIVSLTAGEYEYFCPLNPTPKFTITVK